MADQPKTADDVKAFVDDRDIRFVRLWFTAVSYTHLTLPTTPYV